MHFLSKKDGAAGFGRLGRPHAAVEVQLVKGALWVRSGSICVAKDDVEWALLPERFHVFSSEDSREIKRDKHLVRLVSVETFDPWHLLTDVRDELLGLRFAGWR